MNKIFIIGNGFDLAHGLKTRYSDFLLWYINQTIVRCNSSPNLIENGFFKLTILQPFKYFPSEFQSLEDFQQFVTNREVQFVIKSDFFKTIFYRAIEAGWVDIEYEYFREIKRIYKKYEVHDIERNSFAHKDVFQLNNYIALIQDNLTSYLQTIKSNQIDDKIKNHFQTELAAIENDKDQILLLNFNYTDTIWLYTPSFGRYNYIVVNIHGRLNDTQNPIIFGYGDEMDEYYQRIENINDNEFLKNMKSFSYFKTGNYLELDRFINSDFYSVIIMGHSCGLSDRVLLNSIFCNDHCKSIKIYYHQRNKDETDYIEKTQEISRHFPPALKNTMRTRIVQLTKSNPLS